MEAGAGVEMPLSRLLPWAAWLWRRPWRGRMAAPDCRGVEIPLDPWLARRASLAGAGLGRCRREPSLRNHSTLMRPHPLSFSLHALRCWLVAGTDGGPLGSHTRGSQMHSFGLELSLELRPAGACPVSGDTGCCG